MLFRELRSLPKESVKTGESTYLRQKKMQSVGWLFFIINFGEYLTLKLICIITLKKFLKYMFLSLLYCVPSLTSDLFAE